jgi:peptidyl-prolyl cis-trans isomerase SurA
MIKMPHSLPPSPLRLAAAIAVAGVLFACQSAQAQVVATVNGDPITAYDIEQRSKLIQLTTRKAAARQEVIEDLIGDKLKVHIGKRYKLEIEDGDVNKSFNEMAHRMRLDGEGLVKVLQAQGVAAYTLKDRVRAEIVWQQIVRAKFSSSLTQNEKDIDQKLETRKKDDKEAAAFEYTLRPILFVVPRNSPRDAAETRTREAEALRLRFTDCDTGIPLARGLRDVAVREPIRKTSADLAPLLRELLDKTPVGRLTAPEVTSQGVEVFALCAKKDAKSDSVVKREVQNEIFSERFQTASKKFLKELRCQAMIEFKDTKDSTDAKTACGNAR